MPLTFSRMSGERILDELGRRLEQERLSRNLTQNELADLAGVSLRTVKNVEAGKGYGLATFIALLRALGLLDRLETLIPEQPISPVQLAKLKGRKRKRASGKRSQQRSEVQINKSTWQWNE